MIARIFVTLKKGVLDPPGQAVARALGRLGFDEVKDARIGKLIEVKLEGSRADAGARVERMCKELLANLVIEEYRYELVDGAAK
jgi:phosphoribosylformylglycinamidine synthase PurS subunit